MEVQHLPMRGVLLLGGSVSRDDRGAFSRLVDVDALRDVTEDPAISYIASAHNHARGTIRGLHYQAAPHSEAKTIWCASGAVFDVIVDLRSNESTFGTWISVDLSEDEPRALHLPQGVAHGYQTTRDHTSLMYLMSKPYEPSSARTIHWRDPHLNISWPLAVTSISDRDAAAPTWAESR